MWFECLIYFYLALFNSLSFSVFFSIFSNDNVFAIRCKWNGRYQNHVCFFFLSTNFLRFPSNVWIVPFSLSVWPGTQIHSGGKRRAKWASRGSLGREKLAEPWLCSPTIPLSSPSLGSFCSLINFFFAVSLSFFAFFTHCVPGPRLGTWHVYFPKEQIGGSTPGETTAIKELHQLTYCTGQWLEFHNCTSFLFRWDNHITYFTIL